MSADEIGKINGTVIGKGWNRYDNKTQRVITITIPSVHLVTILLSIYYIDFEQSC